MKTGLTIITTLALATSPGLTRMVWGQTPAPTTGQPTAPGQPPVVVPPPAGTVTPQPPGVPPQASGNPFDIDTTVRAAIASSSSIAIAQRNVSIGQNRVGEAAAAGKVRVSGSATATRFDAPTTVAFQPGQPGITVLPNHTETLTLAVTQPIDLTGQIRAATNQARLQNLSDTFEVTRLTQERGLQARTLYYNLLRAAHGVQVAQANLRAAQVQQETARRLYEGGVGQKIDLLRANTNVSQAEQDLERARNAYDNALASFNDLIGRPLTTPANLTDVPGVTVGADLPPAAGEGAVGTAPPPFTAFTAPLPDLEKINVDEQITAAQARRPEILRAQALVRAAELGVTLARSGQQPTLAVSATGNYYPTFSLQTPRDKVAALTVSLNVPFYDPATRSRVSEARLSQENARQTLEQTRSSVALEVRQAYLNLVTAARQIVSANAALEQAIAARQLAQVRYAGQVGLFLEVSDAQAALVRAENAQVDAVYNYLVALATYQRAIGQG